MTQYVTLKDRLGPNENVYDTPEKAVTIFKDLSICKNWVLLHKLEEGLIAINYEGWIYQNALQISSVKLPFLTENNPKFAEDLKDLLLQTFKPFLMFDPIHRSHISVYPHSDAMEKDCFFVDIFLCLFANKPGTWRRINSYLSNSQDPSATTLFWLD